MISDITDGIAKSIRRDFTENNYNIYTETVEQGLKQPCFFIDCINQEQKHLLDIRYREIYSFNIIYFPSDREINTECHKVENELYRLLEYIEVDGSLMRGLSMNSRIDDATLHFLVDYAIFVLRPKEKNPYMEELKQYGRNKIKSN